MTPLTSAGLLRTHGMTSSSRCGHVCFSPHKWPLTRAASSMAPPPVLAMCTNRTRSCDSGNAAATSAAVSALAGWPYLSTSVALLAGVIEVDGSGTVDHASRPGVGATEEGWLVEFKYPSTRPKISDPAGCGKWGHGVEGRQVRSALLRVMR